MEGGGEGGRGEVGREERREVKGRGEERRSRRGKGRR